MNGTAARGYVILHAAQRAAVSCDWSPGSSRPQEPEDTQKPPVSTQRSGCHPPTGMAAVVSRGLSSSAPSGLLSG